MKEKPKDGGRGVFLYDYQRKWDTSKEFTSMQSPRKYCAIVTSAIKMAPDVFGWILFNAYNLALRLIWTSRHVERLH